MCGALKYYSYKGWALNDIYANIDMAFYYIFEWASKRLLFAFYGCYSYSLYKAACNTILNVDIVFQMAQGLSDSESQDEITKQV